MNLNINYYSILGANNQSTEKELKKFYYKLSMEHHPDRGGSQEVFAQISEAYTVLSEKRTEYDKKSKFGKDYNELEEFFKIDMEYNHKEAEKAYDDVKKREILDIIVTIDPETFDGTLEFPRYVLCKTCKGTGRSMSAKIQIKGTDGKIKWFESDDECFICEGEGKDRNNQNCFYCDGKGKVGINPCKTCESKGRTLGKQKLKDIKLTGDETRIESMGHWSRGRVGSLIIKTN